MKITASALSLRAFMLLLVGLLVVIALLFAASDLRQSLLTYHNALQLAERNNVSDGCIQAVKNFAFERGRSNVILHSQDPVSPENRHFIDERRAAQGNDIRYQLAPGVHTITIRFRFNKTSSGTPIPHSTEFDLSIDAKAGKTYQIEHVRNDNYSKWSTCIIDASSKNRVSYIITNED